MSVKILIADDEANIRQLMYDLLEIKIPDCQVFRAKNGQEALALFQSEPDLSLCILDVMMPYLDGFEVLETLREKSDTPILLLTALGDESEKAKGFALGADDYITKPFQLSDLLERVLALLPTKQIQS